MKYQNIANKRATIMSISSRNTIDAEAILLDSTAIIVQIFNLRWFELLFLSPTLSCLKKTPM